jgi:hypothetical protein
MNYFPQFWGSGVIYKDHDTSYIFERHDRNFDFCVFRAVFVSYCPLFWGFVDIYKEYDSMYILERNEKNSSFLRLWLFS